MTHAMIPFELRSSSVVANRHRNSSNVALIADAAGAKKKPAAIVPWPGN